MIIDAAFLTTLRALLLRGRKGDLDDDLLLEEVCGEVLDFPWPGNAKDLRVQLAVIHRRTLHGRLAPISS